MEYNLRSTLQLLPFINFFAPKKKKQEFLGKKKCTFFEAPFEPSDDRCGAALSRAVGAAPPSESPVSGAGRGLKLTKIEIIKDLKSLKSLCFFASKNMCNKSRIYNIFSVTWLMWPSRQATSCPLRGRFGYRGHVTQAPWQLFKVKVGIFRALLSQFLFVKRCSC